MNWIPSDRDSSRANSRCLVERANRSKRHTKIASAERPRLAAEATPLENHRQQLVFAGALPLQWNESTKSFCNGRWFTN